LQITLGRNMNFVIGQNGSGKSAVLVRPVLPAAAFAFAVRHVECPEQQKTNCKT